MYTLRLAIDENMVYHIFIIFYVISGLTLLELENFC